MIDPTIEMIQSKTRNSRLKEIDSSECQILESSESITKGDKARCRKQP